MNKRSYGVVLSLLLMACGASPDGTGGGSGGKTGTGGTATPGSGGQPAGTGGMAGGGTGGKPVVRVKNGWLTDPKYAAAARRGWLAIGNKTTSAGKLKQVCPGTPAAPSSSPTVTLAMQQSFYTSITLSDSGDLHGQAPLFWAATALLRPDCPGVR
jgi:hypothetical protein